MGTSTMSTSRRLASQHLQQLVPVRCGGEAKEDTNADSHLRCMMSQSVPGWSLEVRLNFTFNNSPPRSLPHGHAWVATSGLETFGASLPTKQLVSCGEARRHEKSPPSPTASLVSPPAGPARPLRRTRHARRGQPSAESLATPSHRSTFARWTCAVRFLLPPYPRQEQCSLESSGPFLSRMP